jgi:hypothetical protein
VWPTLGSSGAGPKPATGAAPATISETALGARIAYTWLIIQDYDSDPDRWQSSPAPRDVHDVVGPELNGLVLDVGCGDGRLPSCYVLA